MIAYTTNQLLKLEPDVLCEVRLKLNKSLNITEYEELILREALIICKHPTIGLIDILENSGVNYCCLESIKLFKQTTERLFDQSKEIMDKAIMRLTENELITWKNICLLRDSRRLN
jgi:hypothetical protein